jgi:hypothetical protein
MENKKTFQINTLLQIVLNVPKERLRVCRGCSWRACPGLVDMVSVIYRLKRHYPGKMGVENIPKKVSFRGQDWNSQQRKTMASVAAAMQVCSMQLRGGPAVD